MTKQPTSKAGEMENAIIMKIGGKSWLVVPEDGKENDVEECLNEAIQQAIAQE